MHIDRGFIVIAGAVLLLAACASEPLQPSDAGFRALKLRHYQEAQKAFAQQLAKDPHNPLIELDLAVADQDLGRMDLAAPLYRRVMTDGRDIVPVATTNASQAGMTLPTIACMNLRLGLHDNRVC